MTLFRTLLLCLALALPTGAARAATITEQIVSQLTDQGFNQISVSRTLLGRTRIKATSREFQREIVFNPATGEILRDYVVRRKIAGGGSGGGPQAPGLVNPYDDDHDNSGPGSENSGRDDDEDDDDRDDDDKSGSDDDDDDDD